MNKAPIPSAVTLPRRLGRALVACAALVAAHAAQAKDCDLDLQVVLWNPSEALAADPLGGLISTATGGLLPAVEESIVYDYAMTRMRERMVELGVSGRVRQIHAVYSGRPYGWYAWDPAVPMDPVPTERDSDSLGDRWMLVIHLDDPAQAAIRIKRTPPAELALGKLLGADVRGRVYKGVFQAMVPYLEEYGLKVLVNTGHQVRCADVKQRYDDKSPSGF